MNVERLLTHYERIPDSSKAIDRLRRFILDLAVRGKLEPQHPSEGGGASLLVSIKQAWSNRVLGGKTNKQKQWQAPEPSHIPFQIPGNWALVRLGEAMELINGRAFKPADWTKSGLPIVRIQNLNNLNAPFNRYDGEVKNKFLINTGDFLISWSGTPGTSFGAHIWDRGPAILNQHIFKSILIGEAFDVQFLKLAINSRLLELIEQAHGGVGLQHITKPKLEAVVLTLPPLAEQRRIVAKVNELMTLCDKLEAARVKQENIRQRLTIASLARLYTSVPETFQNDARFAINTLSALTARTDQIKKLRHAILNLAIRGKLVEQDTNDEPASELLKRIRAEKKRRLKAGQTRKLKVLPELPLEKTPYPLPQSWQWSQIAHIGVINPRNHAPDDHIASFIPMTMITREYERDSAHEVRTWGDIKKGYSHFAEGDVGLAKITPCFENGKSTIFRNLTGRIGSGTTELHIVRPIFVSAGYILLFLKSPYFIEAGITKMTGTAGQKRVPTEYFINSPFPLPPLAEQHRIVARVDKLMTLCERLETSLGASENIRFQLLDSLLDEALEPNIKQAQVNTQV